MTETNVKRTMEILGKHAENQTVPISMRMSDVTLAQLRERARKLSFEMNQDISYIDLIRKAVEKTYDIEIPAVGLYGDTEKYDELGLGGFWTDERKERFLESDTAKMFQKCIDSGNFSDYIAFAKERINSFVLSHSLGCKLLSKTSGVGGLSGICRVTKDVVSVASVIPRRGAVPDTIYEGEEFMVPGFDIACQPNLKVSNTNPISLFTSIITVAWAIVKEIDSNIVNCLSSAISCRSAYNNSQVFCSDYIYRSNLLDACAAIAQHGVTPGAILVNTTSYINMVKEHLVNGPDLKTALDTCNYGTFEGIPIYVSVRAKPNEIIVCGSSDMVGVFYVPGEMGMSYINKPEKLSHSFIYNIRVGVCVANEWAVSVLRIETESVQESVKEKETVSEETLFNVQVNGENKAYISVEQPNIVGEKKIFEMAQKKISSFLANKKLKKRLINNEEKIINFIVTNLKK